MFEDIESSNNIHISINVNKMKGKDIILISILVIVIISFGLSYYANIQSSIINSNAKMKKFNSIEDIRDFLLIHTINYRVYRNPVKMLTSPELKSMGMTLSESQQQYSLTNVQVKGIDEADYVKTDGRYIYLVNNKNKLYIINAYPPKEMRIISCIEIPNKTITGIYNYHNKIILITREAYRIIPLKSYVKQYLNRTILPEMKNPIANIFIYNISMPAKPSLYMNISFTGWVKSTRLMNKVLYIIVNENSVKNNKVILPVYYINGRKYIIEPKDIYYSDLDDHGFRYTMIFSINLDDFKYNVMTLLTGYTNILYMSYKNIYLTQTIWHRMIIYGNGNSDSRIYKFEIDGLDVKPSAIGEVKGFIYNRFQLDEYKGYLRISTYEWEYINNGLVKRRSYTNIFVLDNRMQIVGSITKIAESEYLYSTRFMNDYAYLVTFRRIDPLFIVDLSNPRKPEIIGELKLPGFSKMLQPIWNDLLIGIGYETDNKTHILSFKISLFDVSEPSKPVEKDKIIFYKVTWSTAVYNIHAILKIPNLKYIGIPIRFYSTTVKEGYLLIKADKEGLHKIGLLILNKPNNSTQYIMWTTYMRGIYIGKYLYIVTNKQVGIYELNTLKPVNSIYILS